MGVQRHQMGGVDSGVSVSVRLMSVVAVYTASVPYKHTSVQASYNAVNVDI